LMSQIAHTNVIQEKKIESYSESLGFLMRLEKNVEAFIPRKLKYNFKPALIVFCALLFTSTGWIASAYAEPGDMFWGTKMAINNVVEKSQIVFTAEDDETKLHLKFASKRADVIKQVSEKTEIEVKKEDKAKIINDTKDKLKENLDDANESLKNTSSDKASEMVKEISLKTSEITKSVKESAEKIKIEDKELAKNLDESVADSQKTSLEMVEVLLQKKVESKKEITEEEKNIITEHIAVIVGNLEDHIESLKEENIEEEKENLKNTSSTIMISSTTTSTQGGSDLVGEIVLNTSTELLNIEEVESILDENNNKEENTEDEKFAQGESVLDGETKINSSTINIGKIVEVKIILDKTQENLVKGKDEMNILAVDDLLGAVQKAKQITEDTKEAEVQINKIEAQNIVFEPDDNSSGENNVENENVIEAQNIVPEPVEE